MINACRIPNTSSNSDTTSKAQHDRIGRIKTVKDYRQQLLNDLTDYIHNKSELS